MVIVTALLVIPFWHDVQALPNVDLDPDCAVPLECTQPYLIALPYPKCYAFTSDPIDRACTDGHSVVLVHPQNCTASVLPLSTYSTGGQPVVLKRLPQKC